MLTGGLVNGIMGLFGGSNGAEQRQYQHEKEMMALQNKYNTQAAAQSMEYAKTMNRINFEQQNQMFDKQAEWNSAITIAVLPLKNFSRFSMMIFSLLASSAEVASSKKI